jgi:hypothetical protein
MIETTTGRYGDEASQISPTFFYLYQLYPCVSHNIFYLISFFCVVAGGFMGVSDVEV